MAEWLFLAVPWGCLWFVIVVFPDHNHQLFLCDVDGLSFVIGYPCISVAGFDIFHILDLQKDWVLAEIDRLGARELLHFPLVLMNRL